MKILSARLGSGEEVDEGCEDASFQGLLLIRCWFPDVRTSRLLKGVKTKLDPFLLLDVII